MVHLLSDVSLCSMHKVPLQFGAGPVKASRGKRVCAEERALRGGSGLCGFTRSEDMGGRSHEVLTVHHKTLGGKNSGFRLTASIETNQSILLFHGHMRLTALFWHPGYT